MVFGMMTGALSGRQLNKAEMPTEGGQKVFRIFWH